jgi:hypothetical protein
LGIKTDLVVIKKALGIGRTAPADIVDIRCRAMLDEFLKRKTEQIKNTA